jgi:hypothetical protein
MNEILFQSNGGRQDRSGLFDKLISLSDKGNGGTDVKLFSLAFRNKSVEGKAGNVCKLLLLHNKLVNPIGNSGKLTSELNCKSSHWMPAGSCGRVVMPVFSISKEIRFAGRALSEVRFGQFQISIYKIEVFVRFGT